MVEYPEYRDARPEDEAPLESLIQEPVLSLFQRLDKCMIVVDHDIPYSAFYTKGSMMEYLLDTDIDALTGTERERLLSIANEIYGRLNKTEEATTNCYAEVMG